MQLVKKKKGKKRPGYRGEGAYQGGATNQGGAGPAGGASSGGNYGGGNGGGGQQPSVDVGFQNALRNERRRKEEITKSQDPNFGQFFGSRVPTFQKPTIGQRLGGLGSTIFGGILSLINPALGLAFKGINFMKNKAPQTFQNFKSSNTLEEFRDKMRGYGRTMPVISNNPAFGGIESLGIFGVDDEEDDNVMAPMAKPTINFTDPNQLSDELMDFEQGQAISPLQARDGGRIQYMDGGLTDLVDIYD